MTELSTALVHYDAMCREIALAYKIDEVKQIRDQAVALRHVVRLRAEAAAKNKHADALEAWHAKRQ